MKSKTIDLLRFPLTILVIWIHAQYTNDILFDNPITHGCCIVLGKVIGRLAVPTFFIISGYLFFLGDFNTQTYQNKIIKRIKTLFIPFIIWNALAILFLYLLQVNNIVSGSKSVTDYAWYDYLYSFYAGGLIDGKNLFATHYTANVSMWFIRDLICMCLISPVFYYLLNHFHKTVLIGFGLCWIFCVPSIPGFTWTAILFFAIGAAISIQKKNIENELCKYQPLMKYLFIGWIIFSGIAVYTYLQQRQYVLQLFNLSIVLGVPFLLLFAKYLNKRNKHFPQYITNATFFIYAAHIFIIMILIGGAKRFIPQNLDIIYAFVYLLSPVICYIVLVPVHGFINKYMPKLYTVICGGR